MYSACSNSSVAQSCPTLWPHGLQHARPHHLPEFAQDHVHCIADTIQPSHPLTPSSALSLSQHQGLFHWIGCSNQETGASASASVLPMSIQGRFPLRWTGLISLLSKGLLESSPAPHFKGINSLVLCHVYGPALTTIHDHLEDHSLDYMDLCRQSDLCFSTHCLGLSQLSWQEAIIFWFYGCSHHTQWFQSPRRGILSLLPRFPLLLAMK